MSKKKLSPKNTSKPVKNDSVIQPIIENEEKNTTSINNQVSEMLEDVHDMVGNISQIWCDAVETIASSMTLTTNLMSDIASGATECAGDIVSRSSSSSDKFMKCANAKDFISLNHNIFDNHYVPFNQFGINCSNHMNSFTKGLSDILSYNLTNNWLERFKNKKKYR